MVRHYVAFWLVPGTVEWTTGLGLDCSTFRGPTVCCWFVFVGSFRWLLMLTVEPVFPLMGKYNPAKAAKIMFYP